MKKLNEIKLFILDMDGTIYLGDELIEGVITFLRKVESLGSDYIFLTNNSSKNSHDYQEKLKALGIEVSLDKIVTSGEVTAAYLAKMAENEEKNVYVVGTESLKENIEQYNFNIVENTAEKVDYLVLGFDTTLTYQKLWDAHKLINSGVNYIATHPDLVCPLGDNQSMPDCGAMISLLEASTGETPFVVGKPNDIMVEYIADKFNVPRSSLAMVGDRLYTDMKMAHDTKITGILVLSGETKATDLKDVKTQLPDYVFESVKELTDEL